MAIASMLQTIKKISNAIKTEPTISISNELFEADSSKAIVYFKVEIMKETCDNQKSTICLWGRKKFRLAIEMTQIKTAAPARDDGGTYMMMPCDEKKIKVVGEKPNNVLNYH